MGSRDVQRRNSARGLTIGARATQLLIYVKQLKETRSGGIARHCTHLHWVLLIARRIQSAFPKQWRDSLRTAEQVHFSEILTPLRFVANSIPVLGPCKATFTPFSLPS
jgi:hypothetical protein